MPESPDSTRTSHSDLTSHLAELDQLDQDEKLQQQQLQQRSSIPMAAFNFINSIIGSGIVGQSRLILLLICPNLQSFHLVTVISLCTI